MISTTTHILNHNKKERKRELKNTQIRKWEIKDGNGEKAVFFFPEKIITMKLKCLFLILVAIARSVGHQPLDGNSNHR